MLKRLAIFGVSLLLISGCGAEVDLHGLTFLQTEDGEQDEPDEVDTPDDGIPCAFYYHCVLEAIDEGDDPSDCLGDVEPSEAHLVGAVEGCRKNVCIKQSQIPGSAAFDPEDFMECVFSSCWQTSGQCALGHGESTCKDFASSYKAFEDGAEDCEEPAMELCVLEALYPVKESHATAVDLLLDCIFNQYHRGQPWETCVSMCNLAVD